MSESQLQAVNLCEEEVNEQVNMHSVVVDLLTVVCYDNFSLAQKVTITGCSRMPQS